MGIPAKTLLEKGVNELDWKGEKCNGDGCGVRISTTITGREYIDGKPYCSRCYYKTLGDFVEQNPLGVPHSVIRQGPLNPGD